MLIINGDCIEEMKKLDDNSVDSIVTDPPYELGFMGKSWDSTGIANDVSMWREALRVLKPGGHLIAFSGTRTYHRMASAIEDAGFEIRDMMQWLYGSGMPHGKNIGDGWNTALKPAHETMCLATKPVTIDSLLLKEIGDVAIFLQLLANIAESNFTLTTTNLNEEEDSVLKSVVPSIASQENLSEAMVILRSAMKTENIDLSMISSWKEVLEENLNKMSKFTIETKLKMITALKTLNCSLYQNTQNSTPIQETNQSGQQLDAWSAERSSKELLRKLGDIQELFAQDSVISREAADYQEETEGLRPANEPMVLARKPLSEKTVADNVMRWGTGGINIDDSRIGTETIVSLPSRNKDCTIYAQDKWTKSQPIGERTEHAGRFPSNVLLDESAAAILDEQSGISVSKKSMRGVGLTGSNVYGSGDSSFDTMRGHNDSGGASRFFYIAKASKRERGEGNVHPTVKPLKLMEYLVTLVTPPNGTVLDPFMGSGTTGIAAKNKGFDFVGIEQNNDYCDIARGRIG